jgi:hypothetical protein
MLALEPVAIAGWYHQFSLALAGARPTNTTLTTGAKMALVSAATVVLHAIDGM